MQLLWRADDLHPSADTARVWAEDELSRPEYQQSLWDRLIHWLFGGPAPTGTGGLSLAPVAAVLVALLVVVILSLAVRRARATAGDLQPPSADLLGDEQLTAAQYRRRASSAHERGDYHSAVVDGFRAIAMAAMERGDLTPIAGMTADEMAEFLGARHASHADLVAALDAAAETFDRARYGRYSPSARDTVAMFALDDRLESLAEPHVSTGRRRP